MTVRGRVVVDDSALMLRCARAGVGLAYLNEQELASFVESGELEVVLEDHACKVPGFFLYFPKRSQHQPKLRAFIDAVRRLQSVR